jgi:hypothetical protein
MENESNNQSTVNFTLPFDSYLCCIGSDGKITNSFQRKGLELKILGEHKLRISESTSDKLTLANFATQLDASWHRKTNSKESFANYLMAFKNNLSMISQNGFSNGMMIASLDNTVFWISNHDYELLNMANS